ncbi:hypothetical protein [Mesomycoplasma hyopneumoniae]|nr:hypothetical protein [Mesomycoplasma hyopneumoniae]NYN92123.1 hypothetical protein [Mesomycoplasma hyopneumoniae]
MFYIVFFKLILAHIFSRVSQFDGKNSLFSEYEYAEIPVNRCFLPVKP